ncbi:hypothetical protein EDD16DRAFT_1884035 [Pisolithus croceorrhizus]|nr:hypothetical protein EV401DRAFT_1864704 [Pisolithus croceorrhizus]KAI6123503.1 hypothetical protein EDD16DRAFT_1884035 [Pisolithus croceorrhizus]KAI6166766.1 hypothetical protein EDD17DRAFT_1470159 [Pisolithus thermaeus]
MSPTCSEGGDNPAAALQGPFTHLPTELLIQIFVLCGRTGGPFTPLDLGIVCRRWREVCVSSPHVWQLIIVSTLSRSISSIRTQADLWITRSFPLPFDVHVELTDCEALLPIISYFLPHIHRWRDLSITFGDHTVWKTSPTNFFQSSECLELQHLDVQLKTPVADDRNLDAENVSFFSCTVSTVGQVSMEIASSYLPSPESLNPLHFASIDIGESCLARAVRSPDLLSFLRRCPNLERFSFRGVCYEEGVLTASPPVVALPRLQTLILDSTCIQRSILSHLHLPALRALHLRQLNMDFLLDNYHITESGDSDDEAHDFSQSPSSDHHTGMGIRKLISRSNPPLEILNMGLSDMRTKDFSWIFDRLPHLRHFAIVGSDMSDKVIRLLKPVPIGGGEGEINGHPQEMRVRLPQLETLRLVSCQQFSGDALVDALTARVRYTDIVTPNQTLTRVVIASCNGFRPNHEEELFWHLRNRLHVP